MRSSDVFRLASELGAAERAFVIATVVRAQSPTSAKAGDKAILTEDGLVVGWVGGSCAEPTVRAEALRALRDGEARLLHLSPEPELPASREGLTFAAMTCFSGGAMEIYIEPHLPEPRLLVCGASPVAQALAELGAAMRLRVTVIDLSGRGRDHDDGRELVTSLEDLPALAPASTFAVVATHGTYDDVALRRLLEIGPVYLGLVASRRRFEAVRRGLLEAGATPEAIARIRAPAGLAIGARQPEEVALSILAEIVELRRSRSEKSSAGAVGEAPRAERTPTTAAVTRNGPEAAGERGAAEPGGCPHCGPQGE